MDTISSNRFSYSEEFGFEDIESETQREQSIYFDSLENLEKSNENDEEIRRGLEKVHLQFQKTMAALFRVMDLLDEPILEKKSEIVEEEPFIIQSDEMSDEENDLYQTDDASSLHSVQFGLPVIEFGTQNGAIERRVLSGGSFVSEGDVDMNALEEDELEVEQLDSQPEPPPVNPLKIKEKGKELEQPQQVKPQAEKLASEKIRIPTAKFIDTKSPSCRQVAALPFTDKTGFAYDYSKCKDRIRIGYEHMQKRVILIKMMVAYVSTESPLWKGYAFVTETKSKLFQANEYHVPETLPNMDNRHPKDFYEVKGHSRAHISILNKLIVQNMNGETFQVEDSIPYVNRKKNNETLMTTISKIFNTIDFVEVELNHIDSYVEFRTRISFLEKFESLRQRKMSADQAKASVVDELRVSLRLLEQFISVTSKFNRPMVTPPEAFRIAKNLAEPNLVSKTREYLGGMIRALN